MEAESIGLNFGTRHLCRYGLTLVRVGARVTLPYTAAEMDKFGFRAQVIGAKEQALDLAHADRYLYIEGCISHAFRRRFSCCRLCVEATKH
jgi:hypothetical protein